MGWYLGRDVDQLNLLILTSVGVFRWYLNLVS